MAQIFEARQVAERCIASTILFSERVAKRDVMKIARIEFSAWTWGRSVASPSSTTGATTLIAVRSAMARVYISPESSEVIRPIMMAGRPADLLVMA